MKPRRAGHWDASAASFALVAALAASTSERRVTIDCSFDVTCAGVNEDPRNVTEVVLVRTLAVPATNCSARTATWPLPFSFVAMIDFLLSEMGLREHPRPSAWRVPASASLTGVCRAGGPIPHGPI